MATYTEMADYVVDWSNRDTSVLDYKTIRQCIRYAHDECYRTLRIAPLETTGRGTVTAKIAEDGFLRVNDDLVEFIQLRKIAAEGPRSYSSFDKPYIVAEAHADARSFNGDSVSLYSDYAFYREGTELHIYPQIQEDEVWEMFYYRRLPEVNARWDIEEFILSTGVENTGTEDTPIYEVTEAQFDAHFEEVTDAVRDADQLADPDNVTVFDEDAFTDAGIEFPIGFTFPNGNVVGLLKLHWLRDTNEKVILFGALHQAFDYLDEQDQSQKYKAKFEQEIQKLNKEEMDRMNSGGNINVNFYNRLI